MDRTPASNRITRRQMLRAATVSAAAAGLAGCTATGDTTQQDPAAASADTPPLNNRIRQVIVSWPYMLFGAKWSLDELCQVARQLGCHGSELLGPDDWSTLAKHDMVCAMSTNGMPDPPFKRGLNNLAHHEEVIGRTVDRIEQCAAHGVPAVIAFNGFHWRDADDPTSEIIPRDEGADNTVEGLKALASHAERHGVNICLEHLNTRVQGDDWRGHPGYQGDDIDYCADIIRRVGSPRVKLLFDIYHVQIMDGDIIARIREYGTDLIGHVHTAGVPGRRELDHAQELNYPAIMQALLDIGYEGYVGQEFIPTREPVASLRHAVAMCDV